jgi:hypothetical protein
MLFAPAVVSAQYLDVAGSIVATSSQSVATTGSTIGLSCLVQDSSGGATGGGCSFTVISSPAGDASVVPGPGGTGAQLNVGSTPGAVVVEMGSPPVTSRVTILVTAPSPDFSVVNTDLDAPVFASVTGARVSGEGVSA